MSVVTFRVDGGLSEQHQYDSLVMSIRSAYAEIHPRDRRDAMVIMHPDMRNLLERNMAHLLTPLPPEKVDPLRELTERPRVDRIFGMPLETYAGPDWLLVEVRAENAHDRAFRRAEERGQRINVVKPLDLATLMPLPPAPKPTLKALLSHWLHKITRGVR